MSYSLLRNISRVQSERVAHTLVTTLGLLLAIVVSAGAANAQAVNRPEQTETDKKEKEKWWHTERGRWRRIEAA